MKKADYSQKNTVESQPEVYERIKLLGKGGFGKVFLVRCKSDYSMAAIKQVDIKMIGDKADLKWID